MLNDDTTACALGALAPPGALEDGRNVTFASLFSAHAAYVLGLLRRLGVDDADVEDVAQEVFLTIHKRLPDFEGRSRVKTWICGIALRKASEYRRKASRRRERPWAELPERVSPSDPEQDAEQHEATELLRRGLAQLPDKQRDVFVLFEIEGLPMAEVVKIVGCRLFTGHSRLQSARQAMREIFAHRANLRVE